MAAAGGSFATAARALGITTSQLVRFIESNTQATRHIEERRRVGLS